MAQLVRAPAFQHANVVTVVGSNPASLAAATGPYGHRGAPTCLQSESKTGAVNGSLALKAPIFLCLRTQTDSRFYPTFNQHKHLHTSLAEISSIVILSANKNSFSDLLKFSRHGKFHINPILH